MKKIIISSTVILIAIVAVILFACKKENDCENKLDKSIKLVTLSAGNSAKSSVTLLEFSSVEHYEATITSLQNQLEQHLDNFFAQHAELSLDSINTLMDRSGFNPDQPLLNFLNNYGVTGSMYLDYLDFENNWLDNNELDMDESPFLYFPFSAVEMSLLNINGEVKIGNNLLKLTKDGFAYVKNTDVATLIRIDNGDMSALLEPNVITNLLEKDGSKGGSCTSWKGRNLEDPYATNKKVNMHVHFHAYPWKGTAAAELSSYEKKDGKWKNYALNMTVTVYATFRDKDCVGSYNPGMNDKGPKNTSNLVVHTAWLAAFPGFRAENGNSVTGKFNYAGKETFLTLSW